MMKLVTVIIVIVASVLATTDATRTNWALGKWARQSGGSVAGGVANRAIDGNTDSNWDGQSCTHTTVKNPKGPDNWWMVNLRDSNALVRSVALTNRGDCCWERLANFKIVVSKTPYYRDGELCASQEAPMGKGETKEFTCKTPLRGQYVFVVIPTGDALTLCEVQVFSIAPEAPTEAPVPRTNIALRKPARQSGGIVAGGVANRAVDGNTDSNWDGQSCTHTTVRNPKGPNNWWAVNLMKPDALVSSVVLTNRGDCCWERLANFRIVVSKTYHPKDGVLCASQEAPMGKGETKEFTCETPLFGKYVYVLRPNGVALTLCEVQVF